MPMKPESVYRKELQNALEKCQFIEETLRMCILSALEIARLQLSSYFPVKYKSEDIGKLSLGTLVNIFSKINDDTVLQRDLKSILHERNDVAHRSLLFNLGELRDETHMTEAAEKMKDVVRRATEIHSRTLDVRYSLMSSLCEVKRRVRRVHP
jgi:hypothetical protein